MKKALNLFFILISLWIFIGCSGIRQNVLGQDKDKIAQQNLVEASARAVKIMSLNPNNRSLNYLLQHAKGVLIFPQIIKAGVIIGGGGGKGIMAARDEDGKWSSPAFYTMGRGSLGLQAGVQRASVIFVFMNEKVMNSAIDSGITLGIDAAIAAGSKSLQACASTKTAYADIYYFSNVEGIFAGIAFDGTYIGIHNKANDIYYGNKAMPQDILLERKFDNHPEADVLKNALAVKNVKQNP